MKQFILSLTLVFFVGAFALPQTAEAKRFGGGKSFGMQKNKNFQQRKATPQQRQAQRQKAQQRQQTVANSGTRSFLGPLAGLAAGGLLAWMFFGDGFDGFQIMDFLLIGLLAFGAFKIFQMLGRRNQQQAEPVYQGASSSPTSNQASREQAGQDNSARFEAPVIGSGLSASAVAAEVAPSWFDAARFTEDAKGHFMAVQEAWNKADANLIKSYVSAELFAELKDMIEKQEVATQVEDLDAQIADESYDGKYFVASVLFSGFIQEDGDAAHSFSEVWHIRRLAEDAGNWEISGIQQIN